MGGTRLCSSRSPYYSVLCRKKSLSKMNFSSPLILIVLLAVISTGEAIQCYTCTSYTKALCADPFTNEDNGLAKSGEEFVQTCPDDGKEYFCRKIYQNVRGDERIIRGCGYEKYTNLAGEEKPDYKTVLEEYNTYVTTCTTDKCNGSTTIRVSMISVLMAMVLAAVFK